MSSIDKRIVLTIEDNTVLASPPNNQTGASVPLTVPSVPSQTIGDGTGGEPVADRSKATISKSAIKTVGIGIILGKRALSFATSNVGRYTQNTHLQTQVNNVLKAGVYTAATIANPVLGIGMIAFDVGSTVFNESMRKRDEDMALANAYVRNGYTSKSDITNSRGRR